MTASVYEQLDDATELLATAKSAWVYPEFAAVASILSDGIATRNAVIQSGAPALREAMRTWELNDIDAVEAIRGYAEDKATHTLTEWDGTTRDVVVMDFAADHAEGDTWIIKCRLLEMSDPVPPGS